MARKTKAEAEQTRRQIIDAARKVFHTLGVSRTTLEKIAQEAGVTRGAVYWHFKDKQDLFFAVREHATLPLVDQVDERLLDAGQADPLAGIEQALLRIFTVLEGDPSARETFEIMIFRCEYVAEFTPVLERINGSCDDLAIKLQGAYRRAAERGLLRPGLDPALVAQETVYFLTGAVDRWLASPEPARVTPAWRALIAQHIALRRA